jgi:hypothetical protein
MFIQINDLEERLLETQLQLERVTDEKLTHTLSIQKCPTNKTSLRYVPPTSETPSTSKIVFVKPAIPESPPSCVDKGKNVMEGEVPDIPQSQAKPLIRRTPPTCHHCGELDISDLSSLISKLSGSHTGRLLKLQCVTNVESAIMSGPGVLHLKRSHPEILFQGISNRGLLLQRRLGSPRNLIWRDQRLKKRKPSMKEHPLSVVSYEIWSDI